tara:strand:+ start:144 stop:281 length:138 start_codon:yes stop_codon:yes gene_type:complete
MHDKGYFLDGKIVQHYATFKRTTVLGDALVSSILKNALLIITQSF